MKFHSTTHVIKYAKELWWINHGNLLAYLRELDGDGDESWFDNNPQSFVWELFLALEIVDEHPGRRWSDIAAEVMGPCPEGVPLWWWRGLLGVKPTGITWDDAWTLAGVVGGYRERPSELDLNAR